MEVKDFLISEDFRILDVIQRLDVLGKKTLFLVKDGKLQGAITDGDIRRWILKQGDLNLPVSAVANFKPRFLWEKDRLSAFSKLKQWELDAIPILNSEREIISIVLRNDKEVGKGKVLDLPVVIMAGGIGSRLYPYTKILPKALIPIGEIPILEHIIQRFYSYGAEHFYLIVNHKKNMIKAYFNDLTKEYQVHYREEETPLGTGGGLSLLKGRISSTFLLSNCDILVEADYEAIYRFHKSNEALITMVCAEQKIRIPYGVVHSNEKKEVQFMEEKPIFPVMTNTGFYVVEPKVIEELEDGEAVNFTEIIEKYRRKGEKIMAYHIDENQWWDMGQIDGMERMERYLERIGEGNEL